MVERNYRLKSLFIHLALIFLLCVVMIPLLWMLLNSLKTNNEMFKNSLALPNVWKFKNYSYAWQKGLSRYFLNSVFITAVSVTVICLVGALAAYGLSRFNFRLKNVIFFFILGGLMVSEYCALVPLYKMMTAAKLYNTQLGLIVIYVAFRLPFSVFLMRSYFLSLPVDVEESAIIDGCNSMRVFWQILLPLSKPIIVSTAIMSSIFIWNEFLFALVFIEKKVLMTMPVGLQIFRGQLKIDYVSSMAGIVISSVPLIILFLIFQKQFVRGLTAGSVKG